MRVKGSSFDTHLSPYFLQFIFLNKYLLSANAKIVMNGLKLSNNDTL